MSERTLLDQIQSPEDVRKLTEHQLKRLPDEIREELLEVTSQTGGHLASSLGAVELTVALLHEFDLSRDRILWDTGHQTYAYKLLTGRRELFQSLRQFGGCCGFLTPAESSYDIFGAGHAGTALSAALGMAAARDRSTEGGERERIVAVVGDGALGTGVSLEGLNSIIENTDDFILVINDNKMSISPNVGALSRYLTRVIRGRPYNSLKRVGEKALSRVPFFGKELRKGLQRVEEATKAVLVPGVLFEELGLRYIGPVNGHDLSELTETFRAVRELREPLVVHAVTEKGRGYPHAEEAPEVFHGTGKFDVRTGQISSSGKYTFSDAFGRSLCKLMQERGDVVAITAGMTRGTGLEEARNSCRDRFFDVGIAEEHAVVFAAGMAAAGWRPIVAIYATFMQRAMDYVFHDVALQKLPVIFALNRSGVVTDGPTHHGIHDLGFWQSVPELSVAQPSDDGELDSMLRAALQRKDGPTILRYPKDSASAVSSEGHAEVEWGKAEILREGQDACIWGVGRESLTALQVAEQLEQEGYSIKVVNPRFVMPMDQAALQKDAQHMPLVTLENHYVAGGFASMAAGALEQVSTYPVLHRGWPRQVLEWGSEDKLRERHRLSVSHLADDVSRLTKGG